MHVHGFVHRDVAARNLLVFGRYANDLVVKVGDLGLSERVGTTCLPGTSVASYVERRHIVLPTGSAPPETRAGQGYWSALSDAFQVAFVLWEVWCGTHCLEDTELRRGAFAKVLEQLVSEGRPSLLPRITGLPVGVKSLLDGAATLAPEQRTTIEQLIAGFESITV